MKSSINADWIHSSYWIHSPDTLFWKNKLLSKLKWEQPLVRVYSRDYKIPRLTYFLSDDGISYSYSGYKHIGEPWPDWFLPLLVKVKEKTKTQFNGCLLNLYRDGNDRMGWHSDNEKELDLTKPIASLSFGGSRDLIFKHKNKRIKKILNLKDGDLLIMNPDCQINWLHSLPTRKKINTSRINLTFRCYCS